MYRDYHSRGRAPDRQAFPDPRMDQLIEQQRRELDFNRRSAIWKEIQTYWAQKFAAVPGRCTTATTPRTACRVRTWGFTSTGSTRTCPTATGPPEAATLESNVKERRGDRLIAVARRFIWTKVRTAARALLSVSRVNRASTLNEPLLL
jgi:hypothetical protein